MNLMIEGGHFWLTFENGYTLSVFNGYGSHTENWDKLEKWEEIFMKRNPYKNSWISRNVEIAILSPNHDMVLDKILNYDDVVKTVDINELIDVINLINNLK